MAIKRSAADRAMRAAATKVGAVVRWEAKRARRAERLMARRFLARAMRESVKPGLGRKWVGASASDRVWLRQVTALWHVVIAASHKGGLLLVLLVLGFSVPAQAGGPLRDTVKWSAWQAAGQLGGDHLSSWYVDNVSRRCVENNPMLARTDGSYATGRGWAFNGVGLGLAASAIYLGKRFHRPTLEKVGKAGAMWGAASGAYYGAHNWAGCSR